MGDCKYIISLHGAIRVAFLKYKPALRIVNLMKEGVEDRLFRNDLWETLSNK